MTGSDRRALRDAFGAFATGVTVVTCMGPDRAPLGFTANSFTSVSLDPPLLLVCLSRGSANHDNFCTAGRFAVNVLSEGQADLSNTFASAARDRFAGVEWRSGIDGVPLIGGVSAWFDCGVHRVVEGGDHTILVGRVDEFGATSRPGLGYVRGAYFTPLQETGVLQRAHGALVSVLVEHRATVWLQDDGAGNLALPTRESGAGGIGAAVDRLLGECPATARPGFIYSVFDDDDGRHRIVFLCSATQPRAEAGFHFLTDAVVARLGDDAARSVLERFVMESALGNYGIYFGNRAGGDVRRLAASVD